MENYHKYILETGSKKHLCPGCNKKTFVLFVDTETGEVLPNKYGRCDREIKCGYFIDPYTSGYADRGSQGNKPTARPKPVPKSVSHIETGMMKGSFTAYKKNNFVQYLNTLFDVDTIYNLVTNYNIGTSKHWPGSTVFWQVDCQGKVRSGKIMLYSLETGKRVKEPFNHITWVHKVLELDNFNLKQCFFGEHLLKQYPSKPVAIVESEKTAIIASAYYPKFIWLASGSLSNLNAEKCKVLTGRNITLFPDLGAFEKWKVKAKKITGTRLTVSNLLERKASEADRVKGLDLADYLVRYDLELFVSVRPIPC